MLVVDPTEEHSKTQVDLRGESYSIADAALFLTQLRLFDSLFDHTIAEDSDLLQLVPPVDSQDCTYQFGQKDRPEASEMLVVDPTEEHSKLVRAVL
jgi:hypothetical protein